MRAFAVICVLLAPLMDLSGTWVINVRKSTFASYPAPTVDSIVVKRVGRVYQLDVTSDMGEKTVEHFTYPVPLGDSETTLGLPDGSRMHTTFKYHGDTVTFMSEIASQGHAVARQLGHMYLSTDGRTLTRDVIITPLTGPSVTPVHVVLVYDRR